MLELDFTGERVVEGKTPEWITRHHLERYKFAARHSNNKDVLDLGCGTGYGSHMLLSDGRAKSVVGIDLSPEAIEYAATRYATTGLEFGAIDIYGLPSPPHGHFGRRFQVVVAFEFIEHVTKPRAALSIISDLLTPDGLLIISTPNRTFNSPWIPCWEEPLNPFHMREFTRGEFQALLERRFRLAGRFGQYVFPGRYISRLFSDSIFQNLTATFSTESGCQIRKLRFHQEAHTMIFVGRPKNSVSFTRRVARKLRSGVLRAAARGTGAS